MLDLLRRLLTRPKPFPSETPLPEADFGQETAIRPMPRRDEVEAMARTAWGEARGEGEAGLIAVMHVIRNRALKPSWWGGGVVEVCHKRWQFSCWNNDDPNRKLALTVGTDDKVYRLCLSLAFDVLDGTIPDPTGGATHYHAAGILPSWRWRNGQPIEPCYVHGRHYFYRDVP